MPFFQEWFELPKVLAFILVTLIYVGNSVASIPLHIGYVKKQRLDILLMIYLAVNLVSSYINGALKLGIWGQFYRYQGVATLLGLYGIYWLASRVDKNRNNISKFIFIAGILNVLLLWGQYFLGYSGRISANLGNPNFTGGFISLASVGIASIYWWPLFIGGVLLTGSRTGLVGLVVVFFLKYYRKTSRMFWLAIIAIILAVGIIIPIRPVSHFDSRWMIWDKAMMAIVEKPILGWGRENFETAFKFNLNEKDFDLKNIRVDKAHNETLEILTATGLVGAIIYIWIIVEAGVVLWKNRQNKFIYLNFIILGCFIVVSQLNVLNITEYIFLYFALGTARSLKIRE